MTLSKTKLSRKCSKNIHLDFKGKNSLHFVDKGFTVGLQSFFNLFEDGAALEFSGRIVGLGRILEGLGVDGHHNGSAQSEVVLKSKINVRDLSFLSQTSKLMRNN